MTQNKIICHKNDLVMNVCCRWWWVELWKAAVVNRCSALCCITCPQQLWEGFSLHPRPSACSYCAAFLCATTYSIHTSQRNIHLRRSEASLCLSWSWISESAVGNERPFKTRCWCFFIVLQGGSDGDSPLSLLSYVTRVPPFRQAGDDAFTERRVLWF